MDFVLPAASKLQALGASFAGSREGPLFPALLALTDTDLDDIAHFLEKISER